MTPELADVRPILAAVRQRVDALAPRRGPWVPSFSSQVRDVVLIASSSRGGSSVFSETLRESPDLLHLQAELNPLLTLAGLHPLATGTGSDAIPPGTPLDRMVLDRELALDAGHRPALHSPVDLHRWAADIAWRLTIQWPHHRVDADAVDAAVHHAWHTIVGHNPSQGLLPHAQAADSASRPLPSSAAAAVLGRIHVSVHEQLGLDPTYTDLPPALLQGRPEPSGPPGHAIVEEPPFVAVGPWQRCTAADLERPLIIKTPSNAYRLRFLAELFPRARVRVLHLTRNPAASTNGLVDGWTWRGFHAHPVVPSLQVHGYSDARPADAGHWKYDLFPGWQD